MSKSNNMKPPRTATKEQTKLPNILNLDDSGPVKTNNSNTGAGKSLSNVENDTKSLVDKLVNL